jgi:hypothetical protein
MTDAPQPTDFEIYQEDIKKWLQPGDSILTYAVENQSPQKKTVCIEPLGSCCDILPLQIFTVLTIKRAQNNSPYGEVLIQMQDDTILLWLTNVDGYVFDSDGKLLLR